MATNIQGTDASIWLGDERLLANVAIIGPLSLVLSVCLLFVGARNEWVELSTIGWWTALASCACHLWFALLKTKYSFSLYQFIAWKWGNSTDAALKAVRQRARGMVKATLAAWALAAMLAPLCMLMIVAHLYPAAIMVYAIPIVLSMIQSTLLPYTHRALRAEIERIGDLPPVCEVRL